MSYPIQDDLAGCRLSPLNDVRLRIPIEKDIQFWDFGNPAAVDLRVELDGELHSRSLTLP